MRTTMRLDPQQAALLLIDFQEEQRVDDNYSVAGFSLVVARARELLLAARKERIAIIHAAYRRDFGVSPPRPFEPVTMEGKPTFSDKENTLTVICHEVAPIQGEHVFYKNDASAFSEVQLTVALVEAGVEWLVVAGVWTDACVAATVRDAMTNGL